MQGAGARNDQDDITVAGGRLLVALAAAETEFACLIALSDVLERDGPRDTAGLRRTRRLVVQIASVMHRLNRAVSAVDGDAAPLRLAAQRLERAARAATPQIRRLAAPMAAEALHVADDDIKVDFGAAVPARPTRQGLLAPIRAHLTWKSLILRHAVRVAVSVTAAFLLAEGFKLPYGYWMTTTVALIQQPYLSSSWIRAIERVVGGVLGGGLAALLGMAFHSNLALLILMFPLAMACMSFRAVNYSLYIFFLTPLFVLILDLTHPGVREVSIAGIRALNTVIGGFVALAGSLLLWPGSEGDRLKLALADAVDRNGKLARVALTSLGDDVRPIRTARREAGLASNRAEETRRRAALEIWWRRDELNGADRVLAAVRRLGGTAVALWLDDAPQDQRAGDQAVGVWAAETASQAAASLREGRSLGEPSEAPEPGRAGPIVEEIRSLYQAAQALADGRKAGT